MTSPMNRLAAELSLERSCRKAAPVLLDPAASASEAFRAVTLECGTHWRSNAALVIEERAMVQLHQMRVGIRRLRSAFSLFRPLWASIPGADALAHELRTTAMAFGPCRDLDVLLTGGLVDGLERGQLEVLIAARIAAYDHTFAVLRSTHWLELSDSLERVLTGPLWSAAEDRPALALADAALSKRFHRIVRRGRRLRRLSGAERHEVRIEAKKLRYGCEFFESLYAGELPVMDTPQGPVSAPKAFSLGVEELQGVLGVLNDHETATAYLATVGAHLEPLAEGPLIDEAERVHARVAAAIPFWHP